MADFIVYTYDNMETVAAVLNGVASIMGGSASNYRDMIRTLGALGLLVAIVSFLVNPTRIAAFSWFGGFMFVYFLLFMPVTRVNVVDVVKIGAARTVDNVPAALAMTASVSSTVGYKLTRVFETVMQVLPISLGNGSSTVSSCGTSPEEECMLRFSQGGMMFGNKLMARIDQAAREGASAVDPKLDKDMHEFLSQCSAYDLSQKQISYDDVGKSTDLWPVLQNTSAARYVNENNSYKDCPSAYTSLAARRDAMGDKLELAVARTMFPNQVDAEAKRLLNNSYKDYAAATQVGNAGWQVKQFLLQNTLINQAKRGLGRMGMESGSPSAVMLGQAEAATFASTNASFITQSRLAEEALPLIRNGIEAILYGIFPIVVLVMMVQSGQALVTAIKGFVFAFVWIQLWPPLYALVNYVGQVRSMQSLRIIVDSMRPDASASELGVAFSNYNNIYNGQVSDQAVMGYLIIAVPVIASSIIYGMNSAMGAIGGGAFVGSAGRAGEAAGSGNVNMGNVSMGQQTLGPARTDADVFSNNSTEGSYKYALGEGGMDYSGGQFNATQGPFRVSMSSQNISSLKNSYAESLAATESEAKQLSQQVSTSFNHSLATNADFAKHVESSLSQSQGHGSTDSRSFGSADSIASAGGFVRSEGTQNSVSSGTDHANSVGASMFGSGANKTDKNGTSTTDTNQMGTQTSGTATKNLSAQEMASLQASYEESRRLAKGERQTFSSSDKKDLSAGEAAARLESMSHQIERGKQVVASLETMEANKATVERDLVHEATKGLNRERGDSTYVQRLSDSEKEAQVTAYAGRLLEEKYHLSRDEAQSLMGGSRAGHTVGAVGGGAGRASSEAAGMTPESLGGFLGSSGSTSLSGRQYASPEGLHAQHRNDEFRGGAGYGKVSNADMGVEVQQHLAGSQQTFDQKVPEIKGAATRRITDNQDLLESKAIDVKAASIELENRSAGETILDGAVNFAAEGGTLVTDTAKGLGIASKDASTANELLRDGGSKPLTQRGH